MNEFLAQSAYFGLFFGLLVFWAGTKLSRKLHSGLANPLLLTTAAVILFLTVFQVDYETFDRGASHLTY